MNLEALGNNTANVALNAAISDSQDAKSAENAREASAAILGGAGVTVTTASATSEEVAQAVAARDPRAELMEETVTALLTNADVIDQLCGDLKAYAAAVGEIPTSVKMPTLSGETLVKASQEFAKGNAEAAEEVIVDGSDWSSSTETEDTYFSIYALINLMQQVGQEQRNAARELRECELNAEVASITNEANTIRNSATLGFIVSAVTCGIQAGMLVGSAVNVGSSVRGPSNTSSSQNLAQAKTSVATTEAAMKVPENPQAAAQNTAKIEAKTSTANKAAVNDRLSQAEGYKHQAVEIKEKIPEVESFKASQQQELASLEQERTTINPSDAQALQENWNKTAQVESNIAGADNTIKSLNSQYETAKQNCYDSMNGEMSKMNGEYEAASKTTTELEDKHVDEHSAGGLAKNHKNAKAASASQKNQKNIGQQRSLMEAKVTEMKAEFGDIPTTEDLSAKKGAVAKCEAEQQTSKGFRMASAQGQNRAQTLQFLQQMVGQLGNSLGGMISGLGQADAKALEAEQKEFEAERQETNDLFSQAQDLINNARQLLQAVLSAESQSIERIIQA